MKTEITQDLIRQMAGSCLSVRARMLNRMVTAIFDEALRPHGIRASQLNILVAVSAFGPVTSQRLCRALHTDRSTFIRAVSRMKDRNWLSSEPSGEGKILRIRATAKGLAKIEQVYPYWEQAQERIVEMLGNSASKTIIAAADRHLFGGKTG